MTEDKTAQARMILVEMNSTKALLENTVERWTKYIDLLELSIVIKKLYFEIIFNPCGESDQLVVHLFSLKMAERSEAKSAKRSFASKIKI